MVHQLLRDATNVDTGASKACVCAAQETQHQMEGTSCTTVPTQYIDETPIPLVQYTLLHTMPPTQVRDTSNHNHPRLIPNSFQLL